MKKKALAQVLLVFALASFAFVSHPAATEKGDIYFIASETELWYLANDRDGLAISLLFYEKASKSTQRVIELVVARELAMVNSPVFVYGQPFNHALAKKLLREEDGSGCGQTLYAGVFFYMSKESEPASVTMCSGGPDKSDATVRKLMEKQWADVKVRYQKDGSR